MLRLAAALALLLSGGAMAADPPLPSGLEPEKDEPALPSGLGSPSKEPSLPSGLGSSEPALPSGLLSDSSKQEDDSNLFAEPSLFDISGFAEARLGARIDDDDLQRRTSIGETRVQFQLERDFDAARFSMTADLFYDAVEQSQDIKLDTGQGWLDLRQMSVLMRPLDNADLEIGRQILTWGTGDLVFINDLFPKDWDSFFIGRNDEYLKAPADAAKLALFFDAANVDIVYGPRFNSDRFIDGRRISFFNPALGRVTGRDFPVSVDTNNKWFDEDELALRVYRNLGAWEGALYGYVGYWKSPGGQDMTTGLATFPRLNVWGASLRGPLGKGIASFEVGLYDSRDDGDGTNPLVNNAEFRLIAGYEQEIMTNVTLNLQYYLEKLLDYDEYRLTLPPGFNARDEHRHVFTARITQLAMNQNLTASLFNYYSPSDKDGYLRGNVNYKLSDEWQIEAGGNIFYGSDTHTFFNQFESNNNLYAGIRFGF